MQSASNKFAPFETDAQFALDSILRRIHFHADVFFRGQLCDTWALDTSGSGHVNSHLVCHGECWLHLANIREATHLTGGDIVVFPDDAAHVIGSSRDHPSAFGIKSVSEQVPMDIRNPGTALICGALQMDRTARKLLMSALPPFLVIKAKGTTSNAPVSSLLDLMFAEASDNQLAASAVLDRLADALLFYVIRELSHRNLPTPGLLGAFGDAHIQRAVLAISCDPGRRWTVESLAQQALLSRSVFAERFYRCCGVSPIDLLTIWRMHLARRWLEQERATVLDVAERCGYESPAAFSKAFKRLMGVGPGQFRKIG